MRTTHKKSVLTAGALICGLLSAGCFFIDDEDRREAEFENVRDGLSDAVGGLEDAAEAMKEAFEGLAEGGSVDQPLHYSEFYEYFDDEIEGFERVSREGSTQGMAGMDVTKLEMRYERADGARIDVELVDLGALPVAAISRFMSDIGYNIDEETDRGWKRSTDFEGNPAMEEFRRSGEGDRGRAEFSSFIANRFGLHLKGRQIEWDDLLDFRDEIDIDDIADRKDDEG